MHDSAYTKEQSLSKNVGEVMQCEGSRRGDVGDNERSVLSGGHRDES